MPEHAFRYTAEEEAYLRAHATDTPIADLAEQTGRSIKALRHKLTRMGIGFKDRYPAGSKDLPTAAQQYVAQHYLSDTDAQMASALGISQKDVAAFRRRSGLTKGTQVSRPALGEERLARPMKTEEIAFHLDGDKFHNASGNLYIAADASERYQVLASLRAAAYEWVKKGQVKFDPDAGEYYLK